jgi:hypothetical protein
MASVYYVEHQVKVIASLDTDQAEIQFKRDGVNSIKIERTLEVGINQTLEIPPSTTDLSVSFGQVATGQFLYVECDREVTLKFNGGTTALKLARGASGRAKLLWDGEFTQLEVTNADADNAAIMTYCIGGAA